MSEPYVGEIRMFAGNFAPRGWAFCDGQLLEVSQNDALFSLYGTIYGGDGRTTFGLPDLRGRVPLHMGQGPGLSNRRIGSKSGEEAVTLTINQIPSHSHTVSASSNEATGASPEGNVFGELVFAGTTQNAYHSSANSTMNSGVLPEAGGTQPHNNHMPFIAINYICALVGTYPSRS